MKAVRFKLLMACVLCCVAFFNINAFAARPANENFESAPGSPANPYVSGDLTYECGGGSDSINTIDISAAFGVSSAGNFDGNVLVNDYQYAATINNFIVRSTNESDNFKLNSFWAVVNTGNSPSDTINISGYDDVNLVVKVSDINLKIGTIYGNKSSEEVTYTNAFSSSGLYGGKLEFGDKWSNLDKIVIESSDNTKSLYIGIDSLDFSDPITGPKVTSVTVPADGHYRVGANLDFTVNFSEAVGQLTGQAVKNMESKNAVLEIKTDDVTYTLPAEDIDIDAVSEKLGEKVQLKDIIVNVKIAKASSEAAKITEDSAKKNSYQIVLKPVEFEITCTNGGKSVSVSRFNNYVERIVEIPDGVDPTKITTGVVVNSDGTVSHVPTVVTQDKDGKYYAKINSLTNSTYTVIWHPVAFRDVENHWSKKYVNEVGSRLIDEGTGDGKFSPDRAITKAEFASMIVKALGLRSKNITESFSDVKKDNASYEYIYTAQQYGILAGYSNGKFGPQDLITREQAMQILLKVMKIAGINIDMNSIDLDSLKNFKDSDKISSYARQAASICIKYGIFDENTKGKLAPKDSFTRAESAVAIIKLLEKAELV